MMGKTSYSFRYSLLIIIYIVDLLQPSAGSVTTLLNETGDQAPLQRLSTPLSIESIMSYDKSIAWGSSPSKPIATAAFDKSTLNDNPTNDNLSAVAAESDSDVIDDSTQGLIESFQAKQRTSRLQNTAASARFRQRRKMREEELTKTLEAVNNKVQVMEDSIKQLTIEK